MEFFNIHFAAAEQQLFSIWQCAFSSTTSFCCFESCDLGQRKRKRWKTENARDHAFCRIYSYGSVNFNRPKIANIKKKCKEEKNEERKKVSENHGNRKQRQKRHTYCDYIMTLFPTFVSKLKEKLYDDKQNNRGQSILKTRIILNHHYSCYYEKQNAIFIYHLILILYIWRSFFHDLYFLVI